jgi:hypothetical protein
MAKRTTHPTAKAAALSSKEQAIRHPRTWAKDMEGTEAELEAQAVAQFDEERREHIPGLALSDIPCNFFVRCKPGGSQTVSLSKYWREPSKWQDAHAELLDSWHYWEPMEPLVPEGWSYAKLVGDAKPERFDLANPRVYSLTGKQMPWTSTPGQVGERLTATFERMLADLYRKAPANGKRAEVAAFLDHHRTKGGNAQALTDHLERMLEHWKENPPQYADLHKLQRVTVEGIGQLTTLVEGWLANAPKVPTSAKANAEGNAPTFAALFGDRLPDVLRAMEDAGIRYVNGRGKRKVVAALHAACIALEKPLPLATLWPAMLVGLFPGTKWSVKVKPIESERQRERAKDYMEAYRAIMDHLK